MGYKFSKWNAINAHYHIETKFGKTISLRTVIRIFHRQGLTLVRPRPVPAKGNREKQQQFLDQLRKDIQNASPNEHFLFFDACSVQRSATVTRMWWQKGEQPTVKICGGRERLHILGFLDATGSKARFTFSETLGAEEFVAFLRTLLNIYPHEKVHLILDNARAHHAKLVQKFVTEQQDHLNLRFLPAYSPMLNPIERFWQFLRESVTHNTYFASFDIFKTEIIAFLRQFKESNEKIRHLCNIYYDPNPITVAAL